MASVQKAVLVPYSAEQMLDLVERIEDYPRFLPWCGGATILERTAGQTIARLDIHYHGVHAHFTTVNRIEEAFLEPLDEPTRKALHDTLLEVACCHDQRFKREP